jgi:hypothetical protein
MKSGITGITLAWFARCRYHEVVTQTLRRMFSAMAAGRRREGLCNRLITNVTLVISLLWDVLIGLVPTK